MQVSSAEVLTPKIRPSKVISRRPLLVGLSADNDLKFNLSRLSSVTVPIRVVRIEVFCDRKSEESSS